MGCYYCIRTRVWICVDGVDPEGGVCESHDQDFTDDCDAPTDWTFVSCREYEAGNYFVLCRPGKKCNKDGGTELSPTRPASGPQKVAGRIFIEAGKYALHCQGTGPDGPCKVAIKKCVDCP